MAQSRLEKIGTIYSRVTALLKTGAMKEENKPLWYEIYKAFPPKYEPRFDRPAPDTPVRKIFYPEDVVRARFHREHRALAAVNMIDPNVPSRMEQFLNIYNQLKEKRVDENELFEKAFEEFSTKLKLDRAMATEQRNRIRQERSQKKSVNMVEVMKVKEEEKDQTASEDTSNINFKPIRLSLDKIIKDESSVEEKK
ncbi:probable 28S ribosomal protein S23, mitochondrial [Trichogramma pretiosum]|uniref:probable 28S ribosomal protein S23, mitochondrial n=1 Tax=Trichogramma pretiosum TaxID=7493 RepID=UPI0006C9A028|nr:probable 28S ribosomal protein S23, mitochondrial [Trichogramma pretiosum]